MFEGATTDTSLRSRLLIGWLWLTRRKRTFADVGALYESIEESQRPAKQEPPGTVRRRLRVQRRQINGRPCYTIRPLAPASAKHVLYLHGGAYVHQIQRDHWKFIARLIGLTGCTVTVPLYPLAPSHHYDDTIAMVAATHREVLAVAPAADQVFMGDSAGGALALGLAQQLRDAGRPQPKEIVLLSPWLDVTMTDPALPALDARDPYLGVAGLAEAGRIYAGALDRRDPRVSPINGDPRDLGRLSLFIGTRDVLLSDARRFRALCEDAGVPLGYHEYDGMFHAWMLATIPEAERATRELARIVTRV
jgi:monoterpene epsilon-lactone hydrolase